MALRCHWRTWPSWYLRQLAPGGWAYGKAVGHWREGDYEVAEQEIRKACKRSPGQGSYWHALGNILGHRGAGAVEMVAVFEAASRAHPRCANHRAAMVGLRWSMNDRDGAERDLLEAMRLAPRDAGLMASRATLEIQSEGLSEERLETLRKAASRDPDWLGTLAFYLWAHAGRFEEAAKVYALLEERRQLDHEALIQSVGFEILALGRRSGAREAYQRVLDRLAPNDGCQWIARAHLALWVAREEREFGWTLDELRAARDQYPAANQFVLGIAEVMCLSGDAEEGLPLARANLTPCLHCHLLVDFHELVHRPTGSGDVARRVFELLDRGIRAPAGPLECHVEAARRAGHPRAEALAVLASAIKGTAEVQAARAAWTE